MKKLNYLRICGVAGLALASAATASAGGSSCCGASGAATCCPGMAASPKTSAMLAERCRNHCVPSSTTTSTTAVSRSAIAASPKVQQMLNHSSPATDTQVVGEAAGYQATGADGITASPKARAMLDERRQTIEIAPLK